MTLKIIDLPNYRLDLHLRGSNTLVVTFECYIPDAPPVEERRGWGAFALWDRKEDWLAVKTRCGRNYYRRQDWFDWLADQRQFFANYRSVIAMGTSMGGYASIAFSRPLNASYVLAISPTSSLAPGLGDWDIRVSANYEEDWSGPYRDAVSDPHGTLTVVIDPFESTDKKHMRRLEPIAHNLVLFPAIGHFTAEWLHRLGGLEPAIDTLLDGGDPVPVLRREARRRRELEQYWGMLGGHQERRGRGQLARRIYAEMQARRDRLIPIETAA